MHSSIIAGNDQSDVDYVNGGSNSFDSEGYNSIGSGNATISPLNAFNQTGDQVGANPMLGPLAANGGPTMTHALSPAVRRSTRAIRMRWRRAEVFHLSISGAQRFNAYSMAMALAARIDIGAVDRQPIPPAVFGDYNRNGFVDAADYTVWRNTLGQTALVPFTGADGNGDGNVTGADFLVWKSHFGQTVCATGRGQQCCRVCHH